jgi:nitrous oxidase accessory protein NosD
MSKLHSLLLTCSLALGAAACGEPGTGTVTEDPSPLSPAPAPAPGVITQPSPTPANPGTPGVPTAPEPAPTYTREWYVSPSGSDTAAGTKGAPFRTIAKAVSVVGPGEIVRVQAGTYAEKLRIATNAKAGTESAKITLKGEGSPRIVPVSGGWYMWQVQRPHWIIDGFEFDVQNAAQVAVTFSGTTQGAVLRNSELHHGAFGSGVNTADASTGVTIENNHIHHFSRGSDDSHGIIINPTSRDVTVRNNVIHDNSGDSVQCIGPEGYSTLAPAEQVLIEGNHMHSNDENAVDIKSCFGVTIRRNRMHGFRQSSSARGEAVVVHLSARDVVIEDNDISDAALGVAIGGNAGNYGQVRNVSIRRNRIRDIVAPEGTGIRVEGSQNVRVLHNTITNTAGFAFSVGHGTNGASTATLVKNNIFASRAAVNLGSLAPDLDMDFNLYLPSAGFFQGSMFVPSSSWSGMSLGSWRATGHDANSVQSNDALASGSLVMPGSGAVDAGADLGLTYCGAAPDLGAFESGCATGATAANVGE